MITLFTDFGPSGPYVGQVKAVLHRQAPGVPVVDLLADAPAFEPKAAAHLLAALVSEFPAGTVFLCVVDPGVGSASRVPVVVDIDGRWFVGPHNGLFDVTAARGVAAKWWEVGWRPERLSNTFHGRDLFAPVAAMLALGKPPPGRPFSPDPQALAVAAEDLWAVIYIDHFGNAMTGIRAASLPTDAKVAVGGRVLAYARTYSNLDEGEGFWYENSIGLVEIAVNRGHAAQVLGLEVGAAVMRGGGGS